MDTRISVIVPVYNVERFLPECIESICAQTYRNLEIILVDDGSPDRCGAICDEYAAKDSRIKVIHKPNGGVSSARNMGLQQALGTFVVFCDGDDRFREDYLEKMLRLMRMPGVDLAVCGFESVDANGNPIRGRRSESCAPEGTVQKMDNDLFWKLFRGKRIGSIWDKAFRMDVIREHGLAFPLGVPFAEDTDFVLQYLAAVGDGCFVAVTDERLYLYLTQYHGSAVQKLRPNQWSFFERLFPMLESHVSADSHRDALREYICSAARFVMDGLLRYDGVLSYARFRESTADMLRSGYFRDAVRSSLMTGYNRLLTAAMKSGNPMAVWLVYLIWKGKTLL